MNIDRRTLAVGALVLKMSALSAYACASDVVEVLPVNDRIVMLHFKDGYVVHHSKGQRRSNEKVVTNPLDVSMATRVTNYRIISSDDPAYRQPQTPIQVGRKSKGTDFAWFADKWENNHAVNDRPDHVKDHWLYLYLPSALQSGKSYHIATGKMAANGSSWILKFDVRSARSESVHVNTVGYAPIAPKKFAYVYNWLGDKGGLDLSSYVGKRFWLVNRVSGKADFEGKLTFRMPAHNAETQHLDETPSGNYQDADVYECDFSAFNKPGSYVVAVEGIGASFPFKIDADVYREPFVTITRGLYHNRSGIALTKPYTSFERPAPHNPKLTPDFAGMLKYTSSRVIDWKDQDNSPADRPAIEAGIKGTIDSCGWYQDAGDWDSYPTHLRVAQELLLAYEMAPKNFSDGELNLPESGNGVPDILDEAAWLPRFCQSLRKELLDKNYGTGGIGLRVCGDHFGGDGEGVPSYEDVHRLYIVSGEDPVSTFRYAGVAAQLAYCLQLAKVKDPKGVDWTKEARESYAWALTHTLTKDERQVKNHRSYAAAALFRLTGEKEFEAQFEKDNAGVGANTFFTDDAPYGPYVYALGGPKAQRDPILLKNVKAAILHTADIHVQSANRRALRWGGDWGFPMLVGHLSTPMVMPVAVAFTLTKGKSYQETLYTTADFFLGTNALNMTWSSGLGPKHPNQLFHMDAWYNGKGQFHPGIVPYGPWRKDKAEGAHPTDHDWANKSLYPNIDLWPGGERWFDNRCSPMNAEFTIHQNTAPSAAIFAFLCAPKRS